MAEAQHRLDQLVGLAASHTEVQDTLSQGSDLGYAWELMASYTEHLQRQVWLAILHRSCHTCDLCRVFSLLLVLLLLLSLLLLLPLLLWLLLLLLLLCCCCC